MRPSAHIPAAVWWITALHIVLVLLYTVMLPTYRAPDEPEHFDLVRFVASERTYPNFDALQLNQQTVASMKFTKLGRVHLEQDEIAERSQRPTFDELAADGPSDRPNRMPQHPPAYYGVMAVVYGFLSFLGLGTASYDVVVMVTRASNVIFAAALPVLAYLTAFRLSSSKVASIAAAAVPLAIPQLTHISGSVNNDNLWILLASLTTYFVATVLRGDTSRRTAITLGALVGLSLLTKAFALVMPLWIIILYIIVWRRGTDRNIVLARLAQAEGVALIVGGWWWLRNLVVYGRLQASIPIYSDPQGIVPDPVFWLKTFVTWFTESFWGWLGFFEAKLPIVVIGAATLVVLATLIVTLLPIWRQHRTVRPGEALFLLLPALLILPIVMVRAYSVYVDTGITAGIQGRYAFPSITALAAILATTWVMVAAPIRRYVPALTLTWAAMMQSAAFLTIMGTYYGTVDAPLSEKISSWMVWSPIGASLTSTLVASVVALFLITIIVSARSGIKKRQVPTEPRTQPRVGGG